MHYKSTQQNSTIRFRRWSRVGYAVFCSLSCCVSIGALAVSVSDKTLQKSEGVSMSYVQSFDVCKAANENDPEELQTLSLQTCVIRLSELNSDSAAACSKINSYIINCNG